MEFVSSILGCVGQYMLDSVKVRYRYLKHYDENIVKLEGLVGTMEARETDVLQAIQVAERNGEEILESVQQWMRRIDGVKVEAKKFLEDNVAANRRCFKGWFPNVRTLYGLSKEAERRNEAIEKLCEDQARFDIKFSLPAPTPGIDSITSKDFVLFQTTELAMEKVMDALKEDSTNFVGIHGMGGVGKTTLVQEIARKCKEERLFDNVVMAVVSQTPNVESIQDQIADFFLPFKLEAKGRIARASQLKNRLRRENKILVILDDIWAKLDLDVIGIPSGEDHNCCKVVITTRRRQVCNTMGSSLQPIKIVGLDVLTEQESWNLFKLQAGDIIESPTMRIVAEKVVKECGCLPIALVTMGNAMRGKDIEEWEGAALELQKSNPINIEGMDENVFKCIKFSYDYLRDEESKACFLLCCLFPEDHDIRPETLVRYEVGLSAFKGIDKIQEARRRAHLIINNLKASALLLSGGRRGCVKMHDVVRDVAKTIASDRYFVRAGEGLKEWPNELCIDGYNGIGGISLMRNEIRKYPDALECPDLEIFFMQDNPVEQEIPQEVFRGMKKLRVLDQSQVSRDRRLEPSFSHLTNLRTLIIDGAWISPKSIWGISALGELKMLQVVSLRRWRFEKPLDALRQMKNLRLLDLTGSENCSSLFNFGEDFNFPKLEELYLTEGMSCGVAELMQCFPRLTVLKFCFNDIIQIPHNFDFSHLDHFDIAVGASPWESEENFGKDFNFPKLEELHLTEGVSCGVAEKCCPRLNVLKFSFRQIRHNFDFSHLDYVGAHSFERDHTENCLHVDGTYERLDDVALPNRVRTLLSRVSIMRLYHWSGLRNIIPYLVMSKDSLAVLKILGVADCDKLEYLFDLKEEVKDVVEEEGGIFANLTDLYLRSLSNLEELWKGHIELVHLRNLRTVYINSCPKLKVVFHWSVAQRLEQLQDLSVSKCDKLEEIVGREMGEEAIHKVLFPQLQHLSIYNLPKLNGLYTGNLPGSQSMPKLKTVRMGAPYVEIAVDGRNLEAVIKENKGLLVPVERKR